MTDEERLADLVEIAKDAEHPWETEGAKIWNEKVKFLLDLTAQIEDHLDWYRKRYGGY